MRQVRSLLGLVRRLVAKARLARYDEYTIAEHFRAQGARIGDGCRLLVKSLGSEPYLVSIGDRTLVSSEVAFFTHDGATWVGRDAHPRLARFGRIDIGDGCFIGARAILLPGVTVGDRAIVGAGSVVTRPVPADSVVAGSPARVIGRTEDYVARTLAAALPLPEEAFPLDRGDRAALRRHLERALPAPLRTEGQVT